MNKFTGFLTPDAPIPEPPEMKWLSLLGAIFCTGILGLIVLFIVFEFSMDMLGKPLSFDGMPTFEETEENRETGKDGESRESRSWRHEDTTDDILARFSLLTPLNRSRLTDREVVVLCTWRPPRGRRNAEPPVGQQLYVDDFLVPWDVQFGKNTWIAKIKMSPGHHHLRTAVFEAEFYVSDSADPNGPAAPPNWPVLKSHPRMAELNRCGDCHYWIDRHDDMIRKGRGLTIGPWKGADESCFFCHTPLETGIIHQHILPPLEDCTQCHVLHGTTSVEPYLLRAPARKLCGNCHEPPKGQ